MTSETLRKLLVAGAAVAALSVAACSGGNDAATENNVDANAAAEAAPAVDANAAAVDANAAAVDANAAAVDANAAADAAANATAPAQ
jgi:hypothetical protein